MLSSICFMPASLAPQSLPPFDADHVLVLLREHGGDVHAGRVVPAEERLACLLRIVAVQPVDDLGGDFLVDGLRAFERQRTGALDLLILERAVHGRAVDDRTRRNEADVRLGIDGAFRRSQTFDRRVQSGGATACSVGDLLMSGKLTCCIASR